MSDMSELKITVEKGDTTVVLSMASHDPERTDIMQEAMDLLDEARQTARLLGSVKPVREITKAENVELILVPLTRPIEGTVHFDATQGASRGAEDFGGELGEDPDRD